MLSEKIVRSEALSRGWVMLAAASTLGSLLLFYGTFYSVHQDLAGSALAGELATTLGEAFDRYSIYFPPAERAWFSIAAALSALTGLRLDLAVVLMTSLALLFGASLAYHIRQQAVGASPLFLAGSLAVLAILPILFKNVFGLREHLVVLGLWPYLILRISDPDGIRIGWRLRLLAGLWLGATLLFKFLYSITVLLVEVTDAVVQRRPYLLLRVENIAAGAVVALYLFLWLGLDPGQRAAIGAMVSAIDANLNDPRTNLSNAAASLVPALAFLVAYRLFELPGRRSAIGLALVIGAVVVSWTQERWYSHHLFPITMAYLAWWWMVGAKLKWWAHLLLALLLAQPVVRQFLGTASFQKAVGELDQVLRQAGQSVKGKRVGILTMHPSPYNQYLAAQGAVRWNALPNIAYVAAELQSFDREEHAGKPPPPVRLDDPGRRLLHEEMLRLWQDMPPDVLILDHGHRWPLRYIDVDWRHVFSGDPRFAALMRHYRPVVAHDGRHVEFTFYVRAH